MSNMISADHSPYNNSADLKRYLFATILPIIFLSLSLCVQLYDQFHLYNLTKKELKGVQMITLLFNSLTDIQKVRGYSQITQWEQHDEVNKNLTLLKTAILNRFKQQNWGRAIEEFNLTPEGDHLVQQAEQLFQIQPNQMPAQQLFSKYTRLITDILQLMQLTADHSSLILDPELETYYLIDVLDKQIPYLAEAIGRVRGIGSGLLAKKSTDAEEREQLHNFQIAIQARIESIKNAQDVITKTSPQLKTSLHLLPENLDTVIKPLISICLCITNNIHCQEMRPEQFFHLATQVIELLSSPYLKGADILTAQLKKRQAHRFKQGGLMFLGTGIAILLMLYFNRSFYLYDQKIHRSMEKLSVTDQLSGLYNRRYLYTVFPKELRNTMQHGEQLFLILLDVDHFKRYNDTYGHPKGDQVLQQIAATMNNVMRRAGDYCFRIGGEEFCILFNAADIETAKHCTNQIRLAIAGLSIPHRENKPHGIITVSLGLVKVPTTTECVLEQVMSKVDRALYMAKREGRNCYVFLD